MAGRGRREARGLQGSMKAVANNTNRQTISIRDHGQNATRGQRALAEVSGFLRKAGTGGIFEVFDLRLQLVDGELQRVVTSVTSTHSD
jgi:hypothetical protein